MMMSDPKKIAMLILSSQGELKEAEGPINDSEEALKAAAGRLIKGIESKEVTEIVEAFKTMYMLCETNGTDDEFMGDDEDDLGFGGY